MPTVPLAVGGGSEVGGGLGEVSQRKQGSAGRGRGWRGWKQALAKVEVRQALGGGEPGEGTDCGLPGRGGEAAGAWCLVSWIRKR